MHAKTALNILDAIYTLCSSIPSLHSASPSLSTGGRLRAWRKGREALQCDYSSWRRLIISINHSWFLTDIDADELPSLQRIKLPHQQSIRPPGPNMTFDRSHFSRHKIIHHVAVLYATNPASHCSFEGNIWITQKWGNSWLALLCQSTIQAMKVSSKSSVRAQEMGTQRKIDKYGVRISPESRKSCPVETWANSNNEVWPYLWIRNPDRGRQQAFR